MLVILTIISYCYLAETHILHIILTLILAIVAILYHDIVYITHK